MRDWIGALLARLMWLNMRRRMQRSFKKCGVEVRAVATCESTNQQAAQQAWTERATDHSDSSRMARTLPEPRETWRWEVGSAIYTMSKDRARSLNETCFGRFEEHRSITLRPRSFCHSQPTSVPGAWCCRLRACHGSQGMSLPWLHVDLAINHYAYWVANVKAATLLSLCSRNDLKLGHRCGLKNLL